MGGTIKLFRFAGIQVYLDFSWFIVAFWLTSQAGQLYHARIWGLMECLGLFSIVLLHEFGHAFACRQVGGIAERIVLGPFGGVAFVRPPPRPGAQLWSIVAGPLVNVILIPVLWVALFWTRSGDTCFNNPDLCRFMGRFCYANTAILIFNLLPFFPLDGGQVVRSLLWFKIGPIRSLKIAATIGMVGSVLLGLFALLSGAWFAAAIAFYLFMIAQATRRNAEQLTVLAEEAASQPAPMPPPPPQPAP